MPPNWPGLLTARVLATRCASQRAAGKPLLVGVLLASAPIAGVLLAGVLPAPGLLSAGFGGTAASARTARGTCVGRGTARATAGSAYGFHLPTSMAMRIMGALLPSRDSFPWTTSSPA